MVNGKVDAIAKDAYMYCRRGYARRNTLAVGEVATWADANSNARSQFRAVARWHLKRTQGATHA